MSNYIVSCEICASSFNITVNLSSIDESIITTDNDDDECQLYLAPKH